MFEVDPEQFFEEAREHVSPLHESLIMFIFENPMHLAQFLKDNQIFFTYKKNLFCLQLTERGPIFLAAETKTTIGFLRKLLQINEYCNRLLIVTRNNFEKFTLTNRFIDYENFLYEAEQNIESAKVELQRTLDGLPLLPRYFSMDLKHIELYDPANILSKYGSSYKLALSQYVDLVFSCIEHVIFLLLPFFDYNQQAESNFVKSTVTSGKFTSLDTYKTFFKGSDFWRNYDYLKDNYRNTTAHGYFSKLTQNSIVSGEANVTKSMFRIHDPLHTQEITMSIHMKAKELLQDFISLCKQQYAYGWVMISRGVNIPGNTVQFLSGIESIEGLHKKIDMLSEHMGE